MRVVLFACLLAIAACAEPATSAPVEDATADLAPDAAEPAEALAGDVPAAAAETLADVADSAETSVAIGACPGGAGCACTANGDCDGALCLDTPDGRVCSLPCTGTCPAGFVCAEVGKGADLQSACVPKWGWRCDPCTASIQCAGPGQVDSRCVQYGKDGAFCGSACTGDGDCGPGFACKDAATIEGGSAQQCVLATADAVCPCSKRAVAKKLATGCTKAFAGGSACSGQRACTAVGAQGLTACDAAAPATETCDGKDQDCDGLVDEGTCDDGNPCTEDKCFGKGGAADGCGHLPKDGYVCDDGDVCTVGDHCVAAKCASGSSVCACKKDSDCGELEDGNLCNGTLVCDLASHACKLAPKTVVVCGTTGDTACTKASCDAKSGKCGPTAVADGKGCDDGLGCTDGDACAGGVCQGTCAGPCAQCPTLYLLAGGPSVQAATRIANGAWQVTPLGKPTVDGVALAPMGGAGGATGAVGLVRHTKLLDLQDNALMFTTSTGKAWTPLQAVGAGVTTRGWPAATVAANGLHVAFQGTDYKNYFASYTGTWSAATPLGAPPAYGPAPGALAFAAGKATFVHADGAKGNAWVARDFAAGVWTAGQDLAVAGEFATPPALVAPTAGAELLAAWVQPGSGQVRHATRTAGTWSAAADVASAWTKDRSALAALADGVLLAFRGTDGKLYAATWSAGKWSAPALVGTAVTVASPALTRGSLGAAADLAWVAPDGSVLHARLVGGAWTVPVPVLQGATSVALTAAP